MGEIRDAHHTPQVLSPKAEVQARSQLSPRRWHYSDRLTESGDWAQT